MSLTVTDSELQIQLKFGRESIRKGLSDATDDRLKGVLSRTQEFGIHAAQKSACDEGPEAS